MDIKRVLEQYDSMFGKASPAESFSFLRSAIDEARDCADVTAQQLLMNEMIGLCRDADMKDEGCRYSEEVLGLFKGNAKDTAEYGTTLVNIAGGYRAYGMYDESEQLFEEAEDVYSRTLSGNDPRLAGLYNNKSLLYQEKGDYTQAVTCLMKALPVIDASDDYVKRGTTRGNIGQTIIALCVQLRDGGGNNQAQALLMRAEIYLLEAVEIFEALGGNDYHYSGTLGALGDLYSETGHSYAAVTCYRRAMRLLELYVGRSLAWERVREKLEKTEKLPDADMKGLEVSKRFFELFGQEIITAAGEYSDRIAIGIAGEGSDAYGFDDGISTDHDFGPGLCVFADDDIPQAVFDELKNAYSELFVRHRAQILREFGCASGFDERLYERRGVVRTGDFYERTLGVRPSGDFSRVLCSLPEDRLAEASNGAVFKAGGEFSGIRGQILSYYPENVRLLKLGKTLHELSQYLQSNYPRAMARQDAVTAALCVARGAESAMETAYLLARRYHPYYKWMRRGLDELGILRDLGGMLDELCSLPMQTEAWSEYIYSSGPKNTSDRVIELTEKIAERILEELRAQSLTRSEDVFLENVSAEIIRKTGTDIR